MSEQPARERILNVPAVIVALVVLFGVVHALFSLVLSEQQTNEALLLFAFIPARYDLNLALGEPWPGGLGADVWTFVTYALLHGDLNHLVFNSVWLLAFGSPVARRFGTLAVPGVFRRRPRPAARPCISPRISANCCR